MVLPGPAGAAHDVPPDGRGRDHPGHGLFLLIIAPYVDQNPSNKPTTGSSRSSLFTHLHDVLGGARDHRLVLPGPGLQLRVPLEGRHLLRALGRHAREQEPSNASSSSSSSCSSWRSRSCCSPPAAGASPTTGRSSRETRKRDDEHARRAPPSSATTSTSRDEPGPAPTRPRATAGAVCPRSRRAAAPRATNRSTTRRSGSPGVSSSTAGSHRPGLGVSGFGAACARVPLAAVGRWLRRQVTAGSSPTSRRPPTRRRRSTSPRAKIYLSPTRRTRCEGQEGPGYSPP